VSEAVHPAISPAERPAASRSTRVGTALIGSVVLHGLGLAGFVAISLLAPPTLMPAQKPVSARLVRLGTQRDPKLLPRKDVTPPPPPKVVEVPGAKPVPFKVRDPGAVASKAQPSADRLRHDLFRAFDKTAAKAEELPGDPDGDPEGDSDTADEGERYFGLILAKARRNYNVAKTISAQELVRLKSTVVLYIGSTGQLIRDPEIQISSGNAQFDEDVVLSLKKAAPFGPPPKHLAKDLQTVGIAIEARP
jgi:outer membrane biosynthesis protein TonB